MRITNIDQSVFCAIHLKSILFSTTRVTIFPLQSPLKIGRGGSASVASEGCDFGTQKACSELLIASQACNVITDTLTV
jgi:hypothetical protein